MVDIGVLSCGVMLAGRSLKVANMKIHINPMTYFPAFRWARAREVFSQICLKGVIFGMRIASGLLSIHMALVKISVFPCETNTHFPMLRFPLDFK